MGGGAPWGAGIRPRELENLYTAGAQAHGDEEAQLRSVKAVDGYNVLAGGSKIGTADGMLVDGDSWTIHYLVVSLGKWLSHERVVIPRQWVQEISWGRHGVSLSVGVQQVESAPDYRDTGPVSPGEEARYRRSFKDSTG